MPWLTENMPIEELLKQYAGYSSEGPPSDVSTVSATKKNLRSSSRHKGCILCSVTSFCSVLRFLESQRLRIFLCGSVWLLVKLCFPKVSTMKAANIM